jgi:FkbM family methyltransferase
MRSSLQTYVRHFPIDKGKTRLVALMWKRLVPREGSLQTRLLNEDIRFTCDLNQFIQRHVYFFGNYEREACELWSRCARSAKVIFDVGANIGVYSVLAAKANPQARVHAFEPTPEVLTSLQQNIELNNLSNITVNGLAVGKENGTAFLQRCTGVDGTNEGMNFIAPSEEVDCKSQIPVSMVSLETYCEQQGIQQIDLMKVDIEGGEFDAFVGAQSLIDRQAIKCIFFELAEWAASRSGHSTDDIKRLLADAGYRLFEIHSGRLRPLTTTGIQNMGSVLAVSEDCDLIDGERINY